jgi:hypothetical protein
LKSGRIRKQGQKWIDIPSQTTKTWQHKVIQTLYRYVSCSEIQFHLGNQRIKGNQRRISPLNRQDERQEETRWWALHDYSCTVTRFRLLLLAAEPLLQFTCFSKNLLSPYIHVYKHLSILYIHNWGKECWRHDTISPIAPRYSSHIIERAAFVFL